MRLPRECYQMQKAIETHLPHLSQPQLTGLALWVCGAILAGSACQNAVASALSPWSNWHNLRQRLREWLYDGGDRATPCQTELDVTLCFAPLLRWVLAWWRSDGLALAIDPTLKGDQTTAIVISVLYRSCAIPVAWHIRHADQPGSWMDPTVELLRELASAVPENMTVIVLCDRGIASPKLWKQIRAQGWHPGMRYRKNITFCADGGKRLPAQHFVSRPDTAWIGRGTAFNAPKSKRRCTLLVVWYAEQEEPWIILTDLAPNKVGPSWYALRFWIELGFKALKSLGWKPEWKTPRIGGLPQAACGHRPKRWLPITVTPVAVRRAPSASFATASTGSGACCSRAASGAASGCCPNPGRNPSSTWRLLAMSHRKNPIPTPVSVPPKLGVSITKSVRILCSVLAVIGHRPEISDP